jgi:hypothetical protein
MKLFKTVQHGITLASQNFVLTQNGWGTALMEVGWFTCTVKKTHVDSEQKALNTVSRAEGYNRKNQGNVPLLICAFMNIYLNFQCTFLTVKAGLKTSYICAQIFAH